MFVTVRYGENQSKIFNANCRNDILLHHIKTCCECRHDDTIDVSDERGAVKNLRNNLSDYATDHLKNRETLILIRVDQFKGDDNQERVTFVPLHSGLKLSREFSEALNPIKEETTPPLPTIQPKQSRRRSSAVEFNLDDLKNGKQKAKNNGSNSARKSISRRSTTRTLIKSK